MDCAQIFYLQFGVGPSSHIVVSLPRVDWLDIGVVVPQRNSCNGGLAECGADVETLLIEIVLRRPIPSSVVDVCTNLEPVHHFGIHCERYGIANNGRFFQHCVESRSIPVSLPLIVELRGAYINE